jgi:hypothetical protein
MVDAPAIFVGRDDPRCTWTTGHRRCPETTGLSVHPATATDGQDRTLCERHERELQARERHRAARFNQ